MADLFAPSPEEAEARNHDLAKHVNYERARFAGEPVPLSHRYVGTVYQYGADVRDFHEKFGLEYIGPIRTIPEELFLFRVKFLFEEILEFASTTNPADELDALVDIAYVAVGSVYLHGIDFDVEVQRSFIPHLGNIQPQRKRPREGMKNAEVMRMMTQLGKYMRVGYVDFDAGVDACTYLAVYCQQCAAHRGLDFNEAWSRVQRANMAKVRTARPEDSKRGSGFDVVKPPGWTAPDHSDLVSDMRQEN